MVVSDETREPPKSTPESSDAIQEPDPSQSTVLSSSRSVPRPQTPHASVSKESITPQCSDDTAFDRPGEPPTLCAASTAPAVPPHFHSNNGVLKVDSAETYPANEKIAPKASHASVSKESITPQCSDDPAFVRPGAPPTPCAASTAPAVPTHFHSNNGVLKADTAETYPKNEKIAPKGSDGLVAPSKSQFNVPHAALAGTWQPHPENSLPVRKSVAPQFPSRTVPVRLGEPPATSGAPVESSLVQPDVNSGFAPAAITHPAKEKDIAKTCTDNNTCDDDFSFSPSTHPIGTGHRTNSNGTPWASPATTRSKDNGHCGYDAPGRTPQASSPMVPSQRAELNAPRKTPTIASPIAPSQPVVPELQVGAASPSPIGPFRKTPTVPSPIVPSQPVETELQLGTANPSAIGPPQKRSKVPPPMVPSRGPPKASSPMVPTQKLHWDVANFAPSKAQLVLPPKRFKHVVCLFFSFYLSGRLKKSSSRWAVPFIGRLDTAVVPACI